VQQSPLPLATNRIEVESFVLLVEFYGEVYCFYVSVGYRNVQGCLLLFVLSVNVSCCFGQSSGKFKGVLVISHGPKVAEQKVQWCIAIEVF
jgi:hypothetical protein